MTFIDPRLWISPDYPDHLVIPYPVDRGFGPTVRVVDLRAPWKVGACDVRESDLTKTYLDGHPQFDVAKAYFEAVKTGDTL